MGMRLTLGLRLGALLVLLAAVPAHAEPSRLAGSTTIESTRSGYAVVRLDRSLEISTADGIPLDLKGAGRFYGVLLRAEGAHGDSGFQASMLAGTEMWGYDEEGVLYPRVRHRGDEESPKTVNMPAGLYRLYVIADGKPVRATLRLPSLDGTISVAPDVPVAQTIMTLPRLDVTGPSSIATYGTEAMLRGEGMWGLRMDFDERNSTRTDVESCEWGPKDSPPALPFGPSCGQAAGLAARLQWMAEDVLFSLVLFPEYGPDWVQSAIDELQNGSVPWIPGSPFQAPWSGKWGLLWSVNETAEPGRWLLGGNAQIYGDPSSSVTMTGLWLEYGGATATLPVVPPPAVASAPAPPATSPAPQLAARPAATPAPRRVVKPAPRRRQSKPTCRKKAKKAKRAERGSCAVKAKKRRRARRAPPAARHHKH